MLHSNYEELPTNVPTNRMQISNAIMNQKNKKQNNNTKLQTQAEVICVISPNVKVLERKQWLKEH